MKNKMIGVAVVTFWLFHPDVAHIVFASLSCSDRGGESRLFNDLDIVCWQGQHASFVSFVSIPAVVLWIFGLPLYFYHVLRNNEAVIRSLESKEHLAKAERYQVESFMKRYGFLFVGLDKDYYYWEICVMLGKAAIIFATEYLSSISGEVQVLVSK